jgi:hypothetical protein
MALSDGLWGKLFARKNGSQEPCPHKERRQSERHRMDLPVRFRLYVPSQPERGTLLIPAQLYDISEHGVGLHKMDFLVTEAGDGAVNMMRTIKRALDPQNIMNPGKIFTL